MSSSYQPHPSLNIDPDLRALSQSFIGGKVQLQNVLQQSILAGGPASEHDAFLEMMGQCNIGFRALAARANMSKSKLTKMIKGEITMPPEVVSKVVTIFEQIRPDLF